MYGYIKGKVTKITPKNIICENNNIGYIITVPNPYRYNLNEEYLIYTHQYVREDEISLYGFLTDEEKDLFLKLISVNGIGPKSALSILATGSVLEITEAIESSNSTYLRKFPGIGPKASQQIILDLKGKINYDPIMPKNGKMEDLTDALVALGYSKKEITKILPKLDSSSDLSSLIKIALKLLTK